MMYAIFLGPVGICGFVIMYWVLFNRKGSSCYNSNERHIKCIKTKNTTKKKILPLKTMDRRTILTKFKVDWNTIQQHDKVGIE